MESSVRRYLAIGAGVVAGIAILVLTLGHRPTPMLARSNPVQVPNSVPQVILAAPPVVKSDTPPVMGQEPTSSGPFTVMASPKQDPTVRVTNQSDIVMRLSLQPDSGKPVEMRIAPRSEVVLPIPVGHYKAEVSDPDGYVRGAVGDATFAEYHEYRAGFTVGMHEPGNGFHIGD